MKPIHAAPPSNINTHSKAKLFSAPVTSTIAAKIAVAPESRFSNERNERARCNATAPSTAPKPKNASNKPNPIELLLRPRAIAGSSAQKALEKKMTQLDRTKRVRILGEYRTYRTAANVAPRIVSTGSVLFRAGRFHPAMTKITPTKDAAFTTN